MNIPKYIIPVLVITALFSGYFFRIAITQPTTNTVLNENTGGKKLDCIVQGVKCNGTATFFTSLFENVTGIGTIETFAADHRAIISYDPDIITPDQIRAIIEQPIELNTGETVVIFQCLSMDEI